jgi:GNAT superfamily N-acetyltransferase
MEYKEIGKNYLPEIVQLNETIFDDLYDWSPYALPQYKEKLSGKTPIIFAAFENAKIIADSISFEKDNNFYIWVLGVAKKYQKRGIGNELFALNEKYAREHGFKKVSVKIYSVSSAMLKLALKRGYQIIERTPHASQSEFDANYLELGF